MFQLAENTPNIRAIGKRVVVEVTTAKDLCTPGGIFLPQECIKNDAKEAFVVGVDPDLCPGVELGHKVILRKFLSQAIRHDGREFRIVSAEEDILAIIPPEMNAAFNVVTQLAPPTPSQA